MYHAPGTPMTKAMPTIWIKRERCKLAVTALCRRGGKNLYICTERLVIMQILREKIDRDTLRRLAANTFGDMIKCVADVRRGLLAVDAGLHSDLERLLLDAGSSCEDLWGFNLYPDERGEDFIEYDSLINIRSWQDNPSRDVLDPGVRSEIASIVDKFVE